MTRFLLHRDEGGEMMGLRWEYVNLDIGVIHLPTSKTLKDTTDWAKESSSQKELIDLLKGLPRHSEWVFVKADGSPTETGTL